MHAHPVRFVTGILTCGLATLVIATVAIATCSTYAADDGLKLEASVDKSRYVVGEPIYLTVILKNAGASSVNVPEALNPQFGSIGIKINDPEGKDSSFVPLVVLDSDALPTPLLPGQVRGEVFPIFFGGSGWTFPAVGQYRVEARYGLPGGKEVTAESVALEIVADAAGGTLIAPGRASGEAGRFLTWEAGDHLRAGIALLEGLLQKHPGSPVANYVYFALGKSQTRFFRDYPAEKVRGPNYDKARQYLSKVNAAALPPYLRVQYEISQARTDLATGNAELARLRLVESDKMIKERPELHVLQESVRRIAREVLGH